MANCVIVKSIWLKFCPLSLYSPNFNYKLGALIPSRHTTESPSNNLKINTPSINSYYLIPLIIQSMFGQDGT